MPSIFVQIASYRDPQLLPTINDMLAKADQPEALTFGICWQYGPEEDPNYFDGNAAFSVTKVPYQESKGLGWARQQANLLYKGEDFVLQLDSHHRFAPHWDTLLVEDYNQALLAPENKPIITTYCTPYSVDQSDDQLNPNPCYMSQYEFSPDKLLMSRPMFINKDVLAEQKVIRGRTLSAHFLFTSGQFIKEVPYDPEIYFGGYTEETTMSFRAFTFGYDFFAPYRQYIWHEYTRANRPKHWDDHSAGEQDMVSRTKTRILFQQEEGSIPEGYVGHIRSLKDYEEFGGFDFGACLIDPYTLQGKEPPNPVPDQSWRVAAAVEYWYSVECQWDVAKIAADNLPSIDLIAVGVETEGGESLYRLDCTRETLHHNLLDLTFNNIVLNFASTKVPHRWVLYPKSSQCKGGTSQWGTRQDGLVQILTQTRL